MKVRILGRFKNGNLAEAIEGLGYETQSAFARAIGTSPSVVGNWLNFKTYPRKRESIEVLERATRMPFEMLFPKEYRDAVDRKLGRPVQATVEMTALPEMPKRFMLPSPEIEYEEKEQAKLLKKGVDEALEMLSEREGNILRKRFFEGLSLRETGWIYKVSPERIRQIEAKALRKLKHPTRCRGLEPFVIDI